MSENAQYRVLDLDCPTCASTVERALQGIDGVDDVAVHYSTGRVEVSYDPAVADATEFETAIENQGYTPRPA